jgi:hypothetical protein
MYLVKGVSETSALNAGTIDAQIDAHLHALELGKEFDDEAGGTFGYANHGLSLAAGAAFYRCSGVDLSGYASDAARIELVDSAGKKAIGYIGPADGAEALGTNLIANGDFEAWSGGNPTSWNAVNATVDEETTEVHGGSSSAKITIDGGYTTGGIYNDFLPTAGKLYKLQLWLNVGDNSHFRVVIQENPGNEVRLTADNLAASGWTEHTIYFTATAVSMRVLVYVHDAAAEYGYLDDVTCKEVTDVGTDGVHIVPFPDYTYQAWKSIEAGLDYNDTSYTFTVYGLTGGWLNIWARRETSVRYSELTPNSRLIWHAGGVYRFILTKVT